MSSSDSGQAGGPAPPPGPGGASATPGQAPGAADGHRTQLHRAQQQAQLTLEELWLRFFALGGDAGLVELEAYQAGLMPLPAGQRDLLTAAVNEALDERLSSARVPYSRPLAPAPPAQQPLELSALTDLLTAGHLTTPDQLPRLADAAFSALGVDVTMYLVDHDQRMLVPARGAGQRSTAPAVPAPGSQPLSIDGTPAGRAFRDVQAVASDLPERCRLWLPLLDGTTRLGVLDVQVRDPTDLDDPVLRGQCQHLASLLGQLMTTVGARGDALDSVRRRRPRSPADELVQRLLPPSTAESDRVTVTGWLEPADTLTGDAFDYALSATSVSLAVFDARGQGLPAALLAAAAVSACRSARRDSRDLHAQAHAVDTSISALGADGSSVTGFLGELDLTTGRLQYLSAGHPDPLLLRNGTTVRALAGGRRAPFGQDPLRPPDQTAPPAQNALGRLDLEPGDCLVVHTDGVTGARDETGEAFGDARLAEFLQRAAAAGHPPPETARRLTHAVLAHQQGHLQDDATVLLCCWQPKSGRGERR